ncbi:D-alanyl-D-alanine carboxypeptidase family protein [Arhodomonas sp. KWT2]|uniref:D-alanyl-D-alanine carboxypeptidase family protein n=1 Tax=Arhodomonas sp. KWT2 TaxID=3344194 RepID=UPI0035BFC722
MAKLALRFSVFALVLATLLGAGRVLAQTQPIPVPDPPSLGAQNYVLMDYHSGRMIASKDPDARVEPASLTKLMTAYVVFKELDAGNIAMDDMVRVSERAWRAPGSRMFIEAGDQVSVANLLRGMIIQSGNDASIALAEYVAGTEDTFAQVMNQYADALGMDNTHYVNATGLPTEEHYSSAHDTAILARALISEFPQYYKFYSTKTFKWNGIEQSNRNKLLWRDKTVDGLKTGHTEAAGYCLTSSAERDGMRLISVVMGTSSANARLDQSQALLNYGFRFFETHRLYQAGKSLTDAPVWKGATDTAPLGVRHDLYVTIPKRQYDRLEASMSVDGRIIAPVEEGKPYGKVQVTLGERTVAEVPLVALTGVEEGGFFGRVMDEVMLWFY